MEIFQPPKDSLFGDHLTFGSISDEHTAMAQHSHIPVITRDYWVVLILQEFLGQKLETSPGWKKQRQREDGLEMGPQTCSGIFVTSISKNLRKGKQSGLHFLHLFHFLLAPPGISWLVL